MVIDNYSELICWGFKVLHIHLKHNERLDSNYYYITNETLSNSSINIGESKSISQNIAQKNYKDRKFIENGDIIIFFDETISSVVDIVSVNNIIDNKCLFADNLLLIRAYNSYFKQLFSEQWFKDYMLRNIRNILYTYNTPADILGGIKNIEVPFKPPMEFAEDGIRPDKKKVDVSLIDVSRTTMSIDTIYKRIKSGEINMDTAFQRKSNLWSQGTKSRFIETIILELPIPSFYFDTKGKAHWDIIDGLQRLSTIRDFLEDKFSLEDLYYLPGQLEGKNYSQLGRGFQRTIEEYDIIVFRIGKNTPTEVKYKIFKNINTSPLTLTAQEIRHTLNQGKPANTVSDFAASVWFKNVVTIPQKETEGMLDRELVLRYLAFKMVHYKDYKPRMSDFLDNAMTLLYVQPEETIEKWKQEWEASLQLLTKLFPIEVLFTRSMFFPETKYPFLTPLFEVLVYGFSNLSLVAQEKIANNPIIRKNIRNNISDLKNTAFINAIDSSIANNKEQLITRFSIIETLINNINHDTATKITKL